MESSSGRRLRSATSTVSKENVPAEVEGTSTLVPDGKRRATKSSKPVICFPGGGNSSDLSKDMVQSGRDSSSLRSSEAATNKRTATKWSEEHQVARPAKQRRQSAKQSDPVTAAASSKADDSNPMGNTTSAAKDDNSNQGVLIRDTEDNVWEEPDYDDKEWFRREALRCQVCNRTFEKPAEAALCITGHNVIRCYCCFKVFSSADILFEHFRQRHKNHPDLESTLICPYCDQNIPYKSVSCHVISVHFRTSGLPDALPVVIAASNKVDISNSTGNSNPEVFVADTEENVWEEPDYKDKEWFRREALRCQVCNRTYEKLREAAICIGDHKVIRCYFCFKVFSSADILFEHFRLRHKHHTDLEYRLICPYCDQSIPYKSVYCHVISVHRVH